MSQSNEHLLQSETLVDVKDAKIAIVSTEWNNDIVTEQINGAERIAKKYHAIITNRIVVPGSIEMPFACKALYNHTKLSDSAPECIIAFGAVIRGGTPHFDYVCQIISDGILQLNLQLDIPVIFGVLTLDNIEQAWERLGGKHGHKGEEAMITALKMIRLNRALS